MISGFSLHTFLYYMAVMAMTAQWMNIMGYSLITLPLSEKLN